MKMASTSIDLIRKKNKFVRAADFFVFRCRCFARLQCRFVRLKVMLHRTIRNDDFWRNTEFFFLHFNEFFVLKCFTFFLDSDL